MFAAFRAVPNVGLAKTAVKLPAGRLLQGVTGVAVVTADGFGRVDGSGHCGRGLRKCSILLFEEIGVQPITNACRARQTFWVQTENLGCLPNGRLISSTSSLNAPGCWRGRRLVRPQRLSQATTSVTPPPRRASARRTSWQPERRRGQFMRCLRRFGASSAAPTGFARRPGTHRGGAANGDFVGAFRVAGAAGGGGRRVGSKVGDSAAAIPGRGPNDLRNGKRAGGRGRGGLSNL